MPTPNAPADPRHANLLPPQILKLLILAVLADDDSPVERRSDISPDEFELGSLFRDPGDERFGQGDRDVDLVRFQARHDLAGATCGPVYGWLEGPDLKLRPRRGSGSLGHSTSWM
jgi:hypothetical protein